MRRFTFADDALKHLNTEEQRILRLLTQPDNDAYIPNLERMWSSVERNLHTDDKEDACWVNWFISSVVSSQNQPAYQYIKASERKKLIEKIESLTNQLINISKANNLDIHIGYSHKPWLKGVFVCEDIPTLYQSDLDENEKMSFTKILTEYANRSSELIQSSNNRQSGDTVQITRFIRQQAYANSNLFGKPLYPVISTLVLVIYNANYSESDISNLLNR